MYRMMPVLPTYVTGGALGRRDLCFRICDEHIRHDYVHCLIHHLKEDSRIAARNRGGGAGHRFGPAGMHHIVACRGGICREHCYVLHQCLLLLMELCIVSGKLQEGCIDLGHVGVDRFHRLCQKVGHVGVDSSGNDLSSVVV